MESLDIGDVIIVKPGERIPMDGRVITGASSINQAPITGESRPIQKAEGDMVYAGSIMRIRILDHIIVGNNRYFSFASEGLIEEYELSFLNLKIKGVSEAKRRIYRAKLFGESS